MLQRLKPCRINVVISFYYTLVYKYIWFVFLIESIDKYWSGVYLSLQGNNVSSVFVSIDKYIVATFILESMDK